MAGFLSLAGVALRWSARRLSIHHPRLLRGWLLDRPFPDVILIELTNDCNQSCPFCTREIMTRSVGYMPAATFRAIVDQAAERGNVLLRVVGLGEAAMHPDFKACIRYASDRGLPMEITSNGHIFNVMTPEEIIASRIVSLGISIDGFGDGSYEKLRAGGDYQELRRNIAAFHAVRKRSAAAPLLTIRNVLLDKDERKRIEKSARFKAEWAGLCDRISFNDYLAPRRTDCEHARFRVCDDVMFNLHIEWDGSTPLCTYQHLIAKQELTQNINSTSIADVWQNRRRQEVRRAHVGRDLSAADFCKRCPKTRARAVYGNAARFNSNASRGRGLAEHLMWRLIARR